MLVPSTPGEAETDEDWVWIAIENAKTPSNLGMILRAMSCFYATDERRPNGNQLVLLYSGNRIQKALQYQQQQQQQDGAGAAAATALRTAIKEKTDTHHAYQYIRQVPLTTLTDLLTVVADVKQKNKEAGGAQKAPRRAIHVVGVDLIKGATSLPFYAHFPPPGAGPTLTIYLFGAEDGSLSPQYVAQYCQDAVYIPTRQSLNLACCIHVLLYDRCCKQLLRQQQQQEEENDTDHMERVFASRNRNNHLQWTAAAAAAAESPPDAKDTRPKRKREGGEGEKNVREQS
ncbi:RNA methyltransferase [Strigomonas culicis]|uniref:RNA methyltransferase n=1 Tax=Strigomonas culicis TaxID=28005 RepID=S9U266_9TRYP|nr:RNA methyltransferase [Strigomonas culicis]|eukprot:EPY22924.1 RNA methyltransferase [Strigomonas culicis]